MGAGVTISKASRSVLILNHSLLGFQCVTEEAGSDPGGAQFGIPEKAKVGRAFVSEEIFPVHGKAGLGTMSSAFKSQPYISYQWNTGKPVGQSGNHMLASVSYRY